jgi:hypothetical protein
MANGNWRRKKIAETVVLTMCVRILDLFFFWLLVGKDITEHSLPVLLLFVRIYIIILKGVEF